MKIIASVDRHLGIGRDGDLLLRIPDDMNRFRELTMGSTVVMGRGTYESIGGPLPGRRNIVLSETMPRSEGMEIVRSPEEAYLVAGPDAWVIGGQSVYESMLPFCDVAYITEIDIDGDADRFLPDIRRMPGWVIRSTSDRMEFRGVGYRFVEYVRV